MCAAQECPLCLAAQNQAANESQRTKRSIEEERRLLPELSANQLPTLEAGPQYFLVPRCICALVLGKVHKRICPLTCC